ncbi:MAG: hydroxymethylglutaryl-CoA reductase, degradative, partial [Woeseiaceae bacterium]
LAIGQILLSGAAEPDATIRLLTDAKGELVALANGLQPNLEARGGGARDIEFFKVAVPGGRSATQEMIVLHLLVDTCDAMGANLVNSMCEGIAPRIEALSGADAVLRILSNLADRSLVTARATILLENLHAQSQRGEAVRDAIVLATEFANADPHRAATHNKGIMNGIDAVAIATGNDWRSIEAAAHAYAVRDGAYRSLTSWSVDAAGNLAGELTMPLKVGTVGGSLQSNPAVPVSLRIAGVSSAVELAKLMAAVGLAQNFAALRALVTVGIQRGHMRLHARSVAASAGAPPEYFERVVAGLIESGEIKIRKAHELLTRMAGHDKSVGELEAHGAAAGKVILLGEHAAVYDRHVLALPLHRAVTASLRESGETTWIFRGPDDERRFVPGDTVPAGHTEMLEFIVERLGMG